MASHALHYGAKFQAGTHPAAVEIWFIQRGGYYTNAAGEKLGLGLFGHYHNLFSLLWSEDDHHRWSDLILKHLLEERITVIMGARDSSKTRTVSKWALCDYYCFPNETLTLMTSTNIRGLELRVWGDIKSLHERAKGICNWLPGNVADSKHGVFTDSVDKSGQVRDMRKGIICVPCIGSSGEYMGESLKDFCGIKQKRRRLVGDELQFIPQEYLKVLDSLDKGDFRAAFLGNPIADNGKALDAVAEPPEGWRAMAEVTKTKVWRNKYNGITINLVGTDSPNFDPETPNKYPYLVDQSDVDRVSARPGGKDSVEWWSQIMGIRKSGAWHLAAISGEGISGFERLARRRRSGCIPTHFLATGKRPLAFRTGRSCVQIHVSPPPIFAVAATPRLWCVIGERGRSVNLHKRRCLFLVDPPRAQIGAQTVPRCRG